ncbi:MAG: nucleoside-diphosphate kinase [Firmicutes bacterium]|nr:nucleoside-diphosphate kinase [Bacillota bacterium]
MAKEKTFVMIKPDGVQRGMMGEVITRLERKGLKMVAARFLLIDRSLAEKHYEEHREKPFFTDLVQFVTSSPVLAMVWEGENAIAVVRRLMGSTNPQEAAPGSIRGDFGLNLTMNILHGSDSASSAQREIALYFSEDDVCTYERAAASWV